MCVHEHVVYVYMLTSMYLKACFGVYVHMYVSVCGGQRLMSNISYGSPSLIICFLETVSLCGLGVHRLGNTSSPPSFIYPPLSNSLLLQYQTCRIMPPSLPFSLSLFLNKHAGLRSSYSCGKPSTNSVTSPDPHECTFKNRAFVWFLHILIICLYSICIYACEARGQRRR